MGKKISKKERKVEIDERFSSMFTDQSFHTKYTIDKRGKPMNDTCNENLEKFYEITQTNDSDNNDAGSTTKSVKQSKSNGKKIDGRVKKKKNLVALKDNDFVKNELCQLSSDSDAEKIDFNDTRGTNVRDSDEDDESSEDELGVQVEEGMIH